MWGRVVFEQIVTEMFSIYLIRSEINNVIFLQALICLVDKKTGDKSKTRPRFVKQDQVAIMRIECSGLICLEQFKLFPQMGRFTLRDESKIYSTSFYLMCLNNCFEFSPPTRQNYRNRKSA